MGRPKGAEPPKRVQKHLWSVAWGPDLDGEIEKRNRQNIRDGHEDSKSGVVKYLCRQGIRYLDAAEVDPTIRDRVEAIYAQVLAEQDAKAHIVGSESERKLPDYLASRVKKAK